MQVGDALDIVEQMCNAGFYLSTDVLQFILQICEESYEYILVYLIFLATCHLFLLFDNLQNNLLISSNSICNQILAIDSLVVNVVYVLVCKTIFFGKVLRAQTTDYCPKLHCADI